ncbi:receptor-like protein 1 [Vitis riparia]|uniref:receptor-like protein 1 n=1 Tax=Vitis riparia TaxID=96939 RepID=UPI00155B3274|nr:receptor-like protein 1 [Vitis riparia]
MGQLLPLGPNIRISSLDISHNQLDGQLQENAAHMIPNIMFLNLSNNGFEGILPSSIAEMSSLRVLDLSNNNFSGEVPKQLLRAKDLEILNLSNNKFHGEIFSMDFNLTGLGYLYLDNNQFRGTLSNVISRIYELQVLDVSNNYMSGEIPSWIGSLPSLKSMEHLEHIHLQGNMLTGLIPRDFLNSSSNLLTLDIRDNRLFGSIPNSISALLKLRILLLRGNLFNGFIPNHLCHLTEISLMDLSNNSFSGPIPRCFGHIPFGEMKKEDLFARIRDSGYEGSRPVYAGYLVKYWGYSNFVYEQKDEVEFVIKNRHVSYKGGILDFISGLDLSCNNLTGNIPYELGMLSWILALNLSHNQLKGSIPNSFSNLSQIESLDLSNNQLSGEIPPQLIGLTFLEVFSVAHNNLSGRVLDMKAQFGTFGESSYEDNPFLCGPMLKRKCNTSIESPYLPSQPCKESEGKWICYLLLHGPILASKMVQLY